MCCMSNITHSFIERLMLSFIKDFHNRKTKIWLNKINKSKIYKHLDLLGVDLSVPVLYFGNMSNALTPAKLVEYVKKSSPYFQDHIFLLPYKKCFFMFQSEVVLKDLVQMDLFYCEQSIAGENISILHFFVHYNDIKIRTWYMHPCGVEMDCEHYNSLQTPPMHGRISNLAEEDHNAVDLDEYIPISQYAFLYNLTPALMLLAEPKNIIQTVHVSEPLPYSIRTGKGKKKAAPKERQYINIELATPVSMFPEFHIATHAKSAHNRRAHYVTLPSGKRVPRRGSKIHGGRKEGAHYDIKE
jgi:hypothetical protein